MTWARNYGAAHYGAGSTETARAKRITIKRCADCGTGISGPGKKRCAPCYDIILSVRNRANCQRYRAQKAQNGGGTSAPRKVE